MVPVVVNKIQIDEGLVYIEAITKNKKGKIIFKTPKFLLLMKMSK